MDEQELEAFYNVYYGNTETEAEQEEQSEIMDELVSIPMPHFLPLPTRSPLRPAA